MGIGCRVVNQHGHPVEVSASQVPATFGQQLEHEVVVDFKPLCIVLNRNGKEQLVVNGRGLMHMEHFRDKTIEEPKVETSEEGSEMQEVLKVNPNAWFEGDSEDAYGEESFVSWEDTKPKHKLEHISSLSDFNTSHQVPNPCP
jgi:alpha 1,3-glucosidase